MESKEVLYSDVICRQFICSSWAVVSIFNENQTSPGINPDWIEWQCLFLFFIDSILRQSRQWQGTEHFFLQHPSIISNLNQLSLFTGTFCAATSCPVTSKGALPSYLYRFLVLFVCYIWQCILKNRISTIGTLKYMELASPLFLVVGLEGGWIGFIG